jgi:hypothetical protein
VRSCVFSVLLKCSVIDIYVRTLFSPSELLRTRKLRLNLCSFLFKLCRRESGDKRTDASAGVNCEYCAAGMRTNPF